MVIERNRLPFMILGLTCSRGSFLTINDFKWDLPQRCYGRCKRGEATVLKQDLKYECRKGHRLHESEFKCDLPCYEYGTGSPECTIRGGYVDPDGIFDRDQNCHDCDHCNPANWNYCMNIQKPRRNVLNMYRDK